MNQDAIKKMLLDIQDSELEFTVTLTGKRSKKVNGLYKPQTHEILLHSKNFQSDNQLVYTAIHEYAHHLQTERREAESGGLSPPGNARAHTCDFWARFHGLLRAAEAKGYYRIGVDESPELAALTETIRMKYLAQSGALLRELGQMLSKAHALCDAANIRFEDYVDRVLRMPRPAAEAITKAAAYGVNPEIGYENMKLVASIRSADKRAEAESQLLEGQTPDTVRAGLKKPPAEADPKTRLEQEKTRIEKTIGLLSRRLKLVEENLAALIGA
jgi:hypothetical protein